jgi:hypothetical protein
MVFKKGDVVRVIGRHCLQAKSGKPCSAFRENLEGCVGIYGSIINFRRDGIIEVSFPSKGFCTFYTEELAPLNNVETEE